MTDADLLGIALNLVRAALDERPVITVLSSKIRQAVDNQNGIPVALNSIRVVYR